MRAKDVLADDASHVEMNGVTVRKGTVAAFIANAAAFEDGKLTGAARQTVLADIRDALPALRAAGLFDVLEIRNPQLRAFVDQPASEPDPDAELPIDLDALYAPPSDMIQKAVLDRLVDFHEQYLRAATFFCLASGSGQGLDASPRGGPAGFVHMLDAHHVAFADWPGNNRIESLRNLERDGRVGLLFLFPGLEIFMRINGQARISTDPALLMQLGEGGRLPKTAIVVAIKEVLLHCGKAVNRAHLWADASRIAAETLPTVGKMMAALAKMGDTPQDIGDDQIAQLNTHYAHAVRNDLY